MPMKASFIVLVTRAGAAGSSLAQRLRSEGWPARHCAPIALTGPADPRSCAERLAAALPADRVILTSPEAVRQAIKLVGAARFGASPVIVPGSGTAAVARKLGLTSVVSPEGSGDSEAMLALPELTTVTGLRILLLAAAGGRRLLEVELDKRGARVERLHVYRRQRSPVPEALISDIAGSEKLLTLISSGGVLDALQAELSPPAWQSVLAGSVVVPSERVAEMVRQVGGRSVIKADGAEDESFCRALHVAASTEQLR